MHRKGHTKKHRLSSHKQRGGFYGASGAIAPGAMKWSAGSEMGDFAVGRAGNAQYGAGKKRGGAHHMGGRSKKQPTKKASARRHGKTRRSMRGGNKYGGVSASYRGSGTAGMADFKGIITRDGSGAPAEGAFNNHGAQPGSGYGSFVKAH